jgi:hypothetical protein
MDRRDGGRDLRPEIADLRKEAISIMREEWRRQDQAPEYGMEGG